MESNVEKLKRYFNDIRVRRFILNAHQLLTRPQTSPFSIFFAYDGDFTHSKPVIQTDAGDVSAQLRADLHDLSEGRRIAERDGHGH